MCSFSSGAPIIGDRNRQDIPKTIIIRRATLCIGRFLWLIIKSRIQPSIKKNINSAITVLNPKLLSHINTIKNRKYIKKNHFKSMMSFFKPSKVNSLFIHINPVFIITFFNLVYIIYIKKSFIFIK